MANVFEGAPDGRQSTERDRITTRFRPQYRALSDAEKALHDEIKSAAVELACRFELVDRIRIESGADARPREGALAMTKLEEAVMWAIKGLTA